jgi:hypothetical protein
MPWHDGAEGEPANNPHRGVASSLSLIHTARQRVPWRMAGASCGAGRNAQQDSCKCHPALRTLHLMPLQPTSAGLCCAADALFLFCPLLSPSSCAASAAMVAAATTAAARRGRPADVAATCCFCCGCWSAGAAAAAGGAVAAALLGLGLPLVPAEAGAEPPGRAGSAGPNPDSVAASGGLWAAAGPASASSAAAASVVGRLGGGAGPGASWSPLRSKAPPPPDAPAAPIPMAGAAPVLAAVDSTAAGAAAASSTLRSKAPPPPDAPAAPNPMAGAAPVLAAVGSTAADAAAASAAALAGGAAGWLGRVGTARRSFLAWGGG